MKREFNLIEIITTTVIVFILLVISFLSYLLFIKDSRNTIRLSDVNKIKEQMQQRSYKFGIYMCLISKNKTQFNLYSSKRDTNPRTFEFDPKASTLEELNNG